MTGFQLTATLSFRTSFHIGTGLSGAGVDRTVRVRERVEKDEDDPKAIAKRFITPDLTGEAIKGSIRGSAERILRWLIAPEMPEGLPEGELDSLPKHPALQRIFAAQSLARANGMRPPLYRFASPRFLDGGKLMVQAGTAINPSQGTAEENTLRVSQNWSANAFFALTIEGRGGAWEDPDSLDYQDLMLLVSAFAAASQIGGRKGSGMGETAISDLHLSPVPKPVFDEATFRRLRASLLKEIRQSA